VARIDDGECSDYDVNRKAKETAGPCLPAGKSRRQNKSKPEPFLQRAAEKIQHPRRFELL